MTFSKTRKFLTAASALAGAILGPLAHSSPSNTEMGAKPQSSSDERKEGDFVIAPRAQSQSIQDPAPSHQSHASHSSHESHASHQSSSPQ